MLAKTIVACGMGQKMRIEWMVVESSIMNFDLCKVLLVKPQAQAAYSKPSALCFPEKRLSFSNLDEIAKILKSNTPIILHKTLF